MSLVQITLGSLFGLILGYFTAYLKYAFDAEKSRFDFRVKILRELWEAVLETKSSATNLDPKGSFVGRDNLSERLEDFPRIHTAAKRIVRFNRPYYPERLHKSADLILAKCMQLYHHVADPGSREMKDYSNLIKEYSSKINQLSEKLCEAIRKDTDRPSIDLLGWLSKTD